MNKQSVTIIIPAYNEAPTIGEFVTKTKKLYPDFEVIVINDGSKDNTAEVAGKAGASVYNHPYNIGNGAAVKAGIRIAKGDILVFMDGDGQHLPEDIARLLEHIQEYDMVVGARTKDSQASVDRAIGNRIYNLFSSYVANFPVQDLTSGFRAVKAEAAKKFVYLLPNTYSYPTTLTLGMLRTGRSVKYIPIRIKRRQKGISDIKIYRDGVRFFMIITKICTLYSPLRVFLPVSFMMFVSGGLNYFQTYIFHGRFTNMSTLLFVTSILVFMMGLISEQICQMRYERRSGSRIAPDSDSSGEYD